MNDIETLLEDTNSITGKTYLTLRSNTSINYQMEYPIEWSGQVGEEYFRFVQKDKYSKRIEDFEFVDYPKSINHLKQQIISEIDKKLKRATR